MSARDAEEKVRLLREALARLRAAASGAEESADAALDTPVEVAPTDLLLALDAAERHAPAAQVEDVGPTVKVGDLLWVVDRGMRLSPCRVVIASESRTHWAVDRGRDGFKVPKVRPELPVTAPNVRFVSRPAGSGLDVYLTDKALADARWIETYRHHLADRVRETSSADLLRQVATLLGYDAAPQALDAGPMASARRS